MTNLVVAGVLEHADAVVHALAGREGEIPAAEVLEVAGLFERFPELGFEVAPQLGWLERGFFLTAAVPSGSDDLVGQLPYGLPVVSRIPLPGRTDALAVPDDLGPLPVISTFQRSGGRLVRFTTSPALNFSWAMTGGSCCGEAVDESCESDRCGTCRRMEGLAGGVRVTVCVCDHDLDGAVR